MTPVVFGLKKIIFKFVGFSDSSSKHLCTGALSITFFWIKLEVSYDSTQYPITRLQFDLIAVKVNYLEKVKSTESFDLFRYEANRPTQPISIRFYPKSKTLLG